MIDTDNLLRELIPEKYHKHLVYRAPYDTVIKNVIVDVHKENEILRKALEFYADKENWYIERISMRDIDTVYNGNLQSDNGGKKARQALKEIE